jgi:tetratricopeptide (TPR) repeat protein
MGLGWLIGLLVCAGCGSPPSHAKLAEGCTQLADGNFTEAVAAFDEAIALHPMYARALFYRARAYQKLDKTKRAIDDYAEAIRLHKAMVAKPDEQTDPEALLLPGDLADA